MLSLSVRGGGVCVAWVGGGGWSLSGLAWVEPGRSVVVGTWQVWVVGASDSAFWRRSQVVLQAQKSLLEDSAL